MNFSVTEGPSVLSEEKQLDRALVWGIAWTGGTKWLTQLLSWMSTLVVARLLTPADFGLVGLATVYLGLVGLLNEFGLGTAIIVQSDLSDEQIAQINTLSVILGLAGLAISCGLALPLAS